jgi:TetR/AcrR family transcriptional regulator, acrAB operon repressor
MRRRKHDAEQTKEALLDAALSVFSRQGIQATRLEDIAAEAKVTRGAIYWHFGGKDGIVRELLHRRIDPVLAMVTEVSTRVIPAIKRMEILIQELLALIEGSTQMRDSFLLEFERSVFGSPASKIHPVMEESTRHFEKVLRGLVKEGQAEGDIRRDLGMDDLLGFLLAVVKGTLMDTRMRLSGMPGRRRAPDPAVAAALVTRAIRAD